ncbi:MAG: hypothetical protein COB76_04995 [Alphaproteobacteria bacterium]|nr:MAG: hypothetical protein COB76_04995 [Alphaproteobacteria bacterium]
MGADLLTREAQIVMTQNPKTIADTTLAVEAVDIMLNKYKQPITSLIAVDQNGTMTGMIRLQTLLAAGVV